MKTQIRLSGTGGQGVIKIALILADAALYDGFNAVQSHAYGPESRGGASKGEVVISDTEIFYPKVELPDIVLCLSQEACDKYASDIRSGGILLIHSQHCSVDIEKLQGVNIYGSPIISTAKTVIGNPLCVNTVALGTLVSLTNTVSKDAVLMAMEDNFKTKILPLNIQAYEEGRKLCMKLLQENKRRAKAMERLKRRPSK